jgi:hypothetical protein
MAMPTDAPSQQGRTSDFDTPQTRPLKAFAFDPSQGQLLGNQMSIAVRYEELERGPVVKDWRATDGIAIVDYDATNRVYYQPVDLDDPGILIRGGLDPNEADPRFHQQMVYAVATDTITHFERALGRRIHWRRGGSNESNIYTLNIYPHAMMEANAFYSPQARGVLFGYFKAGEINQGRNLPGQTVFTCLSHDIIVHEMTHAIIDGVRGHFMEQTNPDVAAFHEAFADIVALFRHFSHTEVLLDAIRRTGGALFETQLAGAAPLTPGATPSITAQIADRNPLVDLALQFGEATGRGKGLRSALLTPPNSDDIRNKFEPHARGSILVSAIFDAYFTTYVRETSDLLRIYRSGGGGVIPDALPDALTRLLADKASSIADVFFKVCVRALDYCPPVDVTFGDFLRAVITSDFDLHPGDDVGLRDAFMQAFRVRGIVPEGSAFFSDVAIAWPKADKELPTVDGLVFGDPNGLTDAQKDDCRAVLQDYVDNHRKDLGFADGNDIDTPSFHPVFRINQDGSLRTDMVVETIQARDIASNVDNPSRGKFPLLGGATLIITKPSLSELRDRESQPDFDGQRADYGKVHYIIAKHLDGAAGEQRIERQRAYIARLGLMDGDDPTRFQIDFALTHRGF